MKIDTSTGWLGEVAAAWAMPSSKWRAPSIEAPYTDTTAPAVRSRKLRLSIPVPAGSGIPGSIAGSPRPGDRRRHAPQPRPGSRRPRGRGAAVARG